MAHNGDAQPPAAREQDQHEHDQHQHGQQADADTPAEQSGQDLAEQPGQDVADQHGQDVGEQPGQAVTESEPEGAAELPAQQGADEPVHTVTAGPDAWSATAAWGEPWADWGADNTSQPGGAQQGSAPQQSTQQDLAAQQDFAAQQGAAHQGNSWPADGQPSQPAQWQPQQPQHPQQWQPQAAGHGYPTERGRATDPGQTWAPEQPSWTPPPAGAAAPPAAAPGWEPQGGWPSEQSASYWPAPSGAAQQSPSAELSSAEQSGATEAVPESSSTDAEPRPDAGPDSEPVAWAQSPTAEQQPWPPSAPAPGQTDGAQQGWDAPPAQGRDAPAEQPWDAPPAAGRQPPEGTARDDQQAAWTPPPGQYQAQASVNQAQQQPAWGQPGQGAETYRDDRPAGDAEQQPAPGGWQQQTPPPPPAAGGWGQASAQQGGWGQAPTGPPAPGSQVPGAEPYAGQGAPAGVAGQQQAPTNANDFAAARTAAPQQQAPTRGLPGLLHRATGGRAHLSMTPAERLERVQLAVIRTNFPGVRQVTFVNPKGGSAKTTAALLTAMTFGQSRGGYVLAWDNNETQGTLGVRSQPDRHSRTVRDLLDDVPNLGAGRVGDLSVYTRSQGGAMFDVLASDEQATAGEMMTARSFEAVRDVVSRFYRIICVDTGNNVRAENWAAAISTTDQLVVTSSVRWESAYSASRMLDHLEQTGRAELVRNAVTVLTLPRKHKQSDIGPVESHFRARTRTVLHAPFDPLLDQGDAIAYGKIDPETRRAYLAIAAAIAEGI